jgi:proline iminopeptidase
VADGAVVDFFLKDASPERQAAYFRRREAGPVHETVVTSQEFIDNYLSNGPAIWFDVDYDGAWLWEGVQANVTVLDHIAANPAALDRSEAAALTTPVFLALGRFDYGVPFRSWDEPKKDFANLQYRLYERSGHTPQFEQPEEFTADVAAWAKAL